MQSFVYSEKFYWWSSLLTTLLIFSTLFTGNPLSKWWYQQDSHALVFLLGMLLVGGTVISGGGRRNKKWESWGLRLGLAAVLTMSLLRLSLAERSHLIEYSVLTYFLFKAASLHWAKRFSPFQIGLLTASFALGIAFTDEGLQHFLPNRVGSWEDLLFDTGAIAFCLVSLGLLGKRRST